MAGMRSFVVELAKTGGRIAREHFATVVQQDVRAKGDRDYVSHVDGLVEDALIRRIRAHHPDHGILGEESGSGGHAINASACWIIDPIDGTTNFIHGIPVFALSIAFCDEQGPHTGVVYDPMRDEMFIAERGLGLWLGNERAACSRVGGLRGALIASALPFRFPQALDDSMAVFSAVQRRCDDHRRSGSAALDLAYTAVGRLDAYYELGIYPWDTAAGELLVRCGGGVASDYRGQEGGLLQRRSLVAAGTAALHAELLAQVAPLCAWLDRPPFAPG
jgi:myo-inositol-1(or 4)-monophosphatase